MRTDDVTNTRISQRNVLSILAVGRTLQLQVRKCGKDATRLCVVRGTACRVRDKRHPQAAKVMTHPSFAKAVLMRKVASTTYFAANARTTPATTSATPNVLPVLPTIASSTWERAMAPGTSYASKNRALQ